MSQHTFLLLPTGHDTGLTSCALGLLRAFDRQGIKVGFCKPIAQQKSGNRGPERSIALVESCSGVNAPAPIERERVEELLASGDDQRLMEEVVSLYQSVQENNDIVIVEGMVPCEDLIYSNRVNKAIAETLDAEIIFVCRPRADKEKSFLETLDIAIQHYGGMGDSRFIGTFINRSPEGFDSWKMSNLLEERGMPVLGIFPEQPEFGQVRVSDLVTQYPEIEILNKGEAEERRIASVRIVARSVSSFLEKAHDNALLVIPADRYDTIMASCLMALNGDRISGILLSCYTGLNKNLKIITQAACDHGLPVLASRAESYETTTLVHELDTEIPIDDIERAELVMESMASCINKNWLHKITERQHCPRMSPAAFRYQLIKLARKASKRIVLPEGDEPRTLKAAAICIERGIAIPVLIGSKDDILSSARKNGVVLPDTIEIIDNSVINPDLVDAMLELRKHKGLTKENAEDQITDPIVLGTMLLQQGLVDGLVSGAIHTTAHTIKPALQLLKTAPGNSIVSSVFFMCLPDQVLVYGDCAVNPDPTAEQLAEIAMQSAISTKSFGIDPRIAMISYSTGSSGSGTDVEKVRAATEIVKELDPELCVDGPIQYDAATIESVGSQKMPDSPVAGKANVFIFPDLNTGNTTYKAVQRSAKVISIGPMLQGMARPVNDLSRGALVEDIVYTIALTAIQAIE